MQVAQQQQPTTPIPQPPQPPQVFIGPRGGFQVVRGGEASAIYEGFRHQRDELGNQLDRLEDQRENITEQLQVSTITEADKKGLEQRLTTIDARIAETEKQIAIADAAVANAAAVPGAVVPPPPHVDRGPPEEFFVLTGLFMFIVILPLTIAYARRIWRRGAAVASAIPQEIYDRFNRLDQAVDSVAIEVERIGEGQRFMTRIFSEGGRAIGQGAVQPVDQGVRDRVAHPRDT